MPQLAFTPGRNGFSFNNTWQLAEPDKSRYQHLMLLLDLIGVSLVIKRRGGFRDRATWNMVALFQLGTIIACRRLNSYTYGLCGGMSFTEMDYFCAGRPVPLPGLTTHPTKARSDERGLRAYIWSRTVSSLMLNTPRVLLWMGLIHFHPRRQQVVKAKIRHELDKLKRIIDSGSPWPLCLIGTTWSPFMNHQVLAVGYEEYGDVITVSVHDSNCPDRLSELRFDFTLPLLRTQESCPSQRRGPLQAVFCEKYRFSQPVPLKSV